MTLDPTPAGWAFIIGTALLYGLWWFALGAIVGRVRTARRIVRHLQDNPKELYDWAERIRSAELAGAREPR